MPDLDPLKAKMARKLPAGVKVRYEPIIRITIEGTVNLCREIMDAMGTDDLSSNHPSPSQSKQDGWIQHVSFKSGRRGSNEKEI